MTEYLPKPLVPVGNRPLLDWHLDALDELGTSSVTLNVSHLGDRIESHVAERRAGGPQVKLLREDAPLGVGGGLLGARSLLAAESRFLVVNADVFHRIDLAAVLDAHDSTGADATVVLRRPGPGEPHDDLLVDGDGAAAGGGPLDDGAQRWRFAGIHVLTPAIFDHLRSPGPLRPGYEGLLAGGARVMAHDCGDATWFDVGTPADYLEANRAAAEIAHDQPPPVEDVDVQPPSLIEGSARIGAGCSLGPHAVIGSGASIGAGSRVADSVVWPETSIPADSALRSCIAYPAGVLAMTAWET